MTTQITSQSASRLVRAIAQRELSSAEVMQAHIDRIEEVNPALNAVILTRFGEALAEAQAADRAQAKGETLGPLHGLPITIKEMFDVQGMPTTAGLTSRASQKASTDATTVARLRRAGAIVVGKTNVPQLGMMAESDNPLYGSTSNPWRLERGPGGSSGGEASIIAAGGSPLGLGSDGGGSIRFPSHACGICGLKPTGKRLSLQGHWFSANWPADWAQPGPMARDVDDLYLALKTLGNPEACRCDESPVPFRDPASVPLNRLRVGVYEQFDLLPVAPAIRRAVQEAAAALRDRGATIVPFEFPGVEPTWNLYMQIFYAEGLRDMRHQLRGSVVDWRVRSFLRLARMPAVCRPPFAAVASLVGQQNIADTLRLLKRPAVSAKRYCQLISAVAQFRGQFQAALDRQQLDALICPASAIPAFEHGDLYANYALVYNGVFNLLGLPAGVIPATRVRPEEVPQDHLGRDEVQKSMTRANSNSAGLPVGVQAVARWWREDVVLAVMKGLREYFCEQPGFPSSPVELPPTP